MKKFGFAAAVASGLIAGVVGLAGPAQASTSDVATVAQFTTGIDHHGWLDQITPAVNVPQVDTTAHQSR